MDRLSDTGRINQKNIALSRFLAFFVLSRFLSNYAVCWTDLIGDLENYADRILYVLMAIGAFRCIPFIVRRLKKEVAVFFICSAVVTALNIILFPQTLPAFRATVRSYCMMCVPAVLFIGNIDDYNILKQELLKISRIIGWICLITLFTFPLGFFYTRYHAEYFSLGYACMLPGLILAMNAASNRNKTDRFLFIIMLVFILLYGNRLPLLALVLFAFYNLAYRMYKKGRMQNLAVLLISVITAGLLGVLFFRQAAAWMYQALLAIGIDSRTLMASTWSRTLKEDPRMIIIEMFLDALWKNPLMVRGINADIVNIGVYPHNIFLELIYQFGVFFGAVLCIFLTACMIKTLKTGFQNAYGHICLIMMFASVTQLMVSLSLWNSAYFWAWILLVCGKRRVSAGRRVYGYNSVLPASVSRN